MDDAERIVLMLSKADDLTHDNILEYILSIMDQNTIQLVLHYVKSIM